jgi:hypothetical protein
VDERVKTMVDIDRELRNALNLVDAASGMIAERFQAIGCELGTWQALKVSQLVDDMRNTHRRHNVIKTESERSPESERDYPGDNDGLPQRTLF